VEGIVGSFGEIGDGEGKEIDMLRTPRKNRIKKNYALCIGCASLALFWERMKEVGAI
jgi:hypothetical protein